MNKSAQGHQNHSSAATHSVLQKSSTLSRRYVKRPSAYLSSDTQAAQATQATQTSQPASDAQAVQIGFARDAADARRAALVAEMKQEHQETVKKHRMKITINQIDNASDLEQAIDQATPAVADAPADATPDLPAAPNPYQAALERQQAPTPIDFVSAREQKDRAIAAALSAVASQSATTSSSSRKKSAKQLRQAKQTKSAKSTKPADSPLSKAMHKQARAKNRGKFILAFATSAACVAILGYLVHLNMPDISVRVAAMQTGIEASYPSYIPRDFQLAAVYTDQDNRVIMEFTSPDGAFTLTEESSSWDSNALLNNYVKSTYKDDYSILREQGITIYVSPQADATWVNGGIRYTLDTTKGYLTKTQIKNIVTSL